MCIRDMSPLYYGKNVLTTRRWIAALVVAIIIVGLVLPYFLWDNYLYIYEFHIHRKGHYWLNAAAAMLLVVPFTVVLWYVETRLDFDMEDRVGWILVPFALVMAVTMNAARHLLVVRLVPDKRGPRSAAGALGLAMHYTVLRNLPLGAVVYVTTGLLGVALAYYLGQIGWDTIRADLRHPLRTAGVMLAGKSAA